MGSLERKMERNKLKDAHKRFKKQWRAENVRRASLNEVPESDVSTTSNTDAPEPDIVIVGANVPNVKMKKVPLLGRTPTLGQYKKMVDNIIAQQKESAEKQAAEFLKRREEEEKKVAQEEWKDE